MLSLHHSEICSWVLCDGVPSNVTAKVALISYFIFCLIISRADESCEISYLQCDSFIWKKLYCRNRSSYEKILAIPYIPNIKIHTSTQDRMLLSSNFHCDMTSKNRMFMRLISHIQRWLPAPTTLRSRIEGSL